MRGVEQVTATSVQLVRFRESVEAVRNSHSSAVHVTFSPFCCLWSIHHQHSLPKACSDENGACYSFLCCHLACFTKMSKQMTKHEPHA